MAPSGDGKENKYSEWTCDELKNECVARKLAISDDATLEQIVDILVKDDKKPPDWGKIYARVLYHTGMNYEEIAYRTIPQIMAILDGAEENIAIKMGMPNVFGSTSETLAQQQKNDGKPPKVSEFANLANMFNKIY